MRSGFTLIEALTALVLFQIGVLALAGTTAVAARDLATANRLMRAQAVAQHRIALLSASACSAAVAGSLELTGGLTETWAVTVSGITRSIADSVTFRGERGRPASVVARTFILCDE